MLLASDLHAAAKRLEARSKQLTETEKRRLEKERIIRGRQAARLAAEEAEKSARRLAQQAAEEEERRAHEAEVEANNGVFWRAQLVAVPAPERIASDKGIKRAADKVLLPASAGRALMAQDAYKNGPLFFRLTTAAGAETHAALLEFSGAEGFIALPRKVIRSLWGPSAGEAECDGTLAVAYRRLPKGERAELQPREASFQEALGGEMRDALEAALAQHSVLSEGDWVEVGHGGRVWDLRVRGLQPGAAVSVIDTDLEAEISPSLEAEERVRGEEERAQAAIEAAARAALEQARRMEAEQRLAAEGEAAAAAAAQRREAVRAGKEAALPPEPEGEGLAACLFRGPDGSRHSRRFRPSDPLRLMFDFVDSWGASGLYPGGYALVTQFPRRVFVPPEEGDAGPALEQAGLDGPRQVLFLEPTAAEQAQQEPGAAAAAGDPGAQQQQGQAG